jgi:aspartate racemase
LGAFWLSSRTGGPSKKNKLKAEIIPCFFKVHFTFFAISPNNFIATNPVINGIGPTSHWLYDVIWIEKRRQLMKTIGMIGGMSWESSIEYYRIINESVRTELGGLHSARSIMYSVEFAEIEALQHQDRWDEAAKILIGAARSLESGGADFAIICTNTMHKLYDIIQQSIRIPLLHIADATAESIKTEGIQKIALLGTRFTMEENFYKGRLVDNYGLDVIIPRSEDRETVHRIIYDELCAGIIQSDSKQKYADIIRRLVKEGAEGIILGCTEIGLLVKQEDSPVRLFDTTEIHAKAAVKYALANELSSPCE